MTPDELEKHIEEQAKAGLVQRLIEQREAELWDEHLGLHEDTGWEPKKLTAADPLPPPSICEYAPGKHLFTPGFVHLLFGAGESGKTAIEYIAAMQEVRKGNAALLIDFEMGDSQVLDRLHVLGMTDEEIDAGIIYVNPEMTLTRRDRDRLVDAVGNLGRPLTLAGVDSLTESAAMDGLQENDTGDMTRWFRSLPRWLVQQWPTCAAVVLDHLPKDKADSEFPIGSQRKRSASHALVSVKAVARFSREHEGHSILTVRRSRDGYLPSGQQVARLDGGPEGFRLGLPGEDDAKIVKQILRRQRIAGYLVENPRSKTGDITKNVEGDTTAIIEELKSMVDDEVVFVEKVGNARLHSLTGVMTGLEDDE